MLKRLLPLLLLFLIIQNGISQPTNTNISNGVIFDGEPFLSINPTNSQNLVAAWMGLKFISGQFLITIKTRSTFDGGANWSTATTLPHFGTGYGAADVSMAFDKSGLLYLSYIDSKQNPDSGGIYVARSTNGGLTWDTPSKAFDMYDDPTKRAIDRPWIVVDNSNNGNAGTLYITTKPAPWIPIPNRNYFKTSSDSGHTWSQIANVDGGTHLVGNFIAAPMASPANTITGKFCAIYPSYVTSQTILPAFYLATSSDKGQTFNYSTVFTAAPAANDTNYKNGYQFITSPIDSNKMIFLLPDAQNGDADIMAYHSNDGGANWIGPQRINDDAIANGKGQDMVWGSYNEQGNLVVTWRDRRNAGTSGFWNVPYDFYYATSSDNGQTFSANQLLSSQLIPFDSLIAQNGNDFMSNVYSGDTLYSVWGDTRSGKMNIYFARTIASTNTNAGITLLDGDEPEWTIFPNPCANSINISAPDSFLKKEIVIYSSNGEQVFFSKISNKTTKINTTNLSKGTYFMIINSEVRQFVKE